MSTNLTSQLKSRDPRARREAIMMIGKTKNRSYLHELKQLSLNDPEEDLRVLAQKAINHLQKQGASAPSLLKTSAVGGALKGNEPGFIRTPEQKIEDKKKSASTQKSSERSAVLVDLLILIVVVLVASVAFALFVLPMVRTSLANSLQPLAELVPSLSTTVALLGDEANLQPVVQVVIGLIVGGIAVLGVFFNNFVFHLSARIMGGLEKYGTFMRKSFVPYAVFTILFTLVSAVLAFIPSETSPLRTVDQIGAISTLIGILFFVVAFIWLSRFIGRTYEMGTGRGFVTVLIGGLLIGAALFALQLAAGMIRPRTG